MHGMNNSLSYVDLLIHTSNLVLDKESKNLVNIGYLILILIPASKQNNGGLKYKE